MSMPGSPALGWDRDVPAAATLTSWATVPCGRYVIASLLTFSLVAPGFAAVAKYYLVIDPVGNCAAIESKPGESAGMKIIGEKGGYD
jgi:hypothetical protein